MELKHEIKIAYLEAIKFAKSHYENFPVVSVFVSKRLYKHVAIVYQFARQADDIADEGEYSDSERIQKLDEYKADFENSLNGIYKSSFYAALSNTIISHELTASNFTNLLLAFRQDITQKQYKNFDSLLSYCKKSANPVGRIILELNNIKSDEAMFYSDKICTALQLTNFLQDVVEDFEKERIYLPLEDIEKYNFDISNIKSKINGNNFQNLMRYQVDRVNKYYKEGAQLLPILPFRLRQQIKWTINGGVGILKKIENINYDVLNYKPIYSKLDFIKLLLNIEIK